MTRFLNVWMKVDSGSPSSCLTLVLTRSAGAETGPPQPFPHELPPGVGERVPESGAPSPGSFPSLQSPHPLIHEIRVCENLRKALLPHPRGVRWRWCQAAQAAPAASAPAGGVSRSSTTVVQQFLEKVTIAFLMDNVGNVCCRKTKSVYHTRLLYSSIGSTSPWSGSLAGANA
jgi:hypothetical protein